MLGHKSNISLIFDFMDTDLEMIIKDKSLLLPPGVVKAYSLMILQVSDTNIKDYEIS